LVCGNVLDHEPSEPAAQRAHDRLGIDDVAALEVALVFAFLGKQCAQRGACAPALFLLFGGRVFAVGDLAGKCFGASARAIEPAGVPRTDLDHAAVDAAAAGRAVHEPERPQAGGQDSHAKAPDDGVPKERLSLPGRHLRPCDPRLGQLSRHWIVLHVTAHRQHAAPQFLSGASWRNMALRACKSRKR